MTNRFSFTHLSTPHAHRRPRIVAQWHIDGNGRLTCQWHLDEGIGDQIPAAEPYRLRETSPSR